MLRRETAPFGSEQLIKLYLETLLILMIRQMDEGTLSAPAIKSIKQKNDSLIYNRITTYLEEHICERLTIETICQDNLIGRSQLQKLFREQTHCGVIDYFSHLKIMIPTIATAMPISLRHSKSTFPLRKAQEAQSHKRPQAEPPQ